MKRAKNIQNEYLKRTMMAIDKKSIWSYSVLSIVMTGFLFACLGHAGGLSISQNPVKLGNIVKKCETDRKSKDQLKSECAEKLLSELQALGKKLVNEIKQKTIKQSEALKKGLSVKFVKSEHVECTAQYDAIKNSTCPSQARSLGTLYGNECYMNASLIAMLFFFEKNDIQKLKISQSKSLYSNQFQRDFIKLWDAYQTGIEASIKSAVTSLKKTLYTFAKKSEFYDETLQKEVCDTLSKKEQGDVKSFVQLLCELLLDSSSDESQFIMQFHMLFKVDDIACHMKGREEYQPILLSPHQFKDGREMNYQAFLDQLSEDDDIPRSDNDAIPDYKIPSTFDILLHATKNGYQMIDWIHKNPGKENIKTFKVSRVSLKKDTRRFCCPISLPTAFLVGTQGNQTVRAELYENDRSSISKVRNNARLFFKNSGDLTLQVNVMQADETIKKEAFIPESIVVHVGGGHYVTYVCANNGHLYRCDDHNIENISYSSEETKIETLKTHILKNPTAIPDMITYKKKIF